MTINSKRVKRYFEENATRWVLDGYNEQGYNYPVGFHRSRIVSRYLSSLKDKKIKVLDLGCGRGDLAFLLAKCGYSVIGIDQSKNMLDLAEKKRLELPRSIQNRTKFILSTVDDLNIKEKFDVVTAMGFIGYFKSDKYIFNIVNKLLKPRGYFVVSCRNQLFNMTSISFRTKDEIKKNKALKLVKEIEKIHSQSQIPINDANKFVKKFREIMKELPGEMSLSKESTQSPSENLGSYESGSDFEPRQNTPDGLKKVALKCGFEHLNYFGVHPHLIDPGLNKLLPPRLFNKLSESLGAFEHLPISLVWSSVFIGIFKKKN